MSAAATDKFKKFARRWVGQIGAGGVADASVTTIPFASTTSLPTDTGVVAVIDRVDANGESGATQAAKEETIVGVVSGSNLVSCVRGAEGTAQAHDAGAVVEILFTNRSWGDLIDGLLVAHNQDGTHKTSLALVTPYVPSFYQDAGLTKLLSLPSTTSDTLAALAATQTFTNKRITKRILSATSYTTDTGSSLNCDTVDTFIVTAQAGALKFNNPGGTPTSGQTLWISVTGTGARALTYDTQFEASAGAALPTTTVTTARLDILFVWRADTSKWHCVASA